MFAALFVTGKLPNILIADYQQGGRFSHGIGNIATGVGCVVGRLSASQRESAGKNNRLTKEGTFRIAVTGAAA